MVLGDFSNQIHDFDPGIAPYPEGLFWTVPVKSSAVAVDVDEGEASLNVRNLNLRDFYNIPNGLFRNDPNHPNVSEPATVSFKLEWEEPVTSRFSLTDATHHFTGRFVANSATMQWSAHRPDGFKFVSDAAKTSHSIFSELGRVRNGVFFEEGDRGE